MLVYQRVWMFIQRKMNRRLASVLHSLAEWHQWSESCDGVVDFVYLMWIYNRCRHIDTSTDFGMYTYKHIYI